MGDWAEDAAERARQEDEAKIHRLKNGNREAEIKNQRGIELFNELSTWVSGQVQKYNRTRGKEELACSVTAVSALNTTAVRTITVKRLDGTKQPLTFTYSPTLQRLICECGNTGPREYRLVIGPDGEVRFETPYHQAMTVEQIGAEMLGEFERSSF